MKKKESEFQAGFIKELKQQFPGCYVLKNDAGYCRGIPDWLVLYGPHWAMLECKRSEAEMRTSKKKQLDQAARVEELGQMSYSNYVYPENKEEVIHDLRRTFGLA